MLEAAVLMTCIEAHRIITNITETTLSDSIKVELIQEVLKVSDCKNGNV